MKVSRAEAAQNRERIIETAAKLFRERGFDGIGVAELMKSAGLTHGGFYGNFASKEDLMAQACTRALEGSLDAMRELVERDGENALSIAASAYLNPTHRWPRLDAPTHDGSRAPWLAGTGCLHTRRALPGRHAGATGAGKVPAREA